MISKKDMVTLAVLGIGGIALASAVVGKGEGEGDFPGASRGILGAADGGEYIPPSFQIPEQPAVTFPKPIDYTPFLEQFFASPSHSPDTYSGGGSMSKKWVDTGKTALGYKGYVTPRTPTPYAPGGYWSESGIALGYKGYVTPGTPTPIAPKKKTRRRSGGGGGGRSSYASGRGGRHSGRTASEASSLAATRSRLSKT